MDLNDLVRKSDIAHAKATLRADLLGVRKERGDAANRDAALSTHLTQRLNEYAPWVIAFYWPTAGEFDARATVQDWLQCMPNRIAALPVITDTCAPLSFYRWTATSPMKEGRFKIPVPADAIPVEPDVLLIPCLGFDTARYRLGYGGGYYDRTLATLQPRPLTIGIGYEYGRLNSLPHEPHDIPLDMILSECGCY